MSANHEYLVGLLEDMSECCGIYGDDQLAVYNGHVVRVEYRWDEVKRCGWGQWLVDGVEMTYDQTLAKLAV